MKATRQQEKEFIALVEEYKQVIYKVCYVYASDADHLNDLYQGVWNKTEQGKALDYYDRNLQYAYVQYLLKELELTKDAEKSKGLSLELLTEDHLPCYGYEYHRHARQMSANTKISDLGISSKTLYYGQLVKLKELLKNRRHSASGDDKVHYDYLYFELNSVLK